MFGFFDWLKQFILQDVPQFVVDIISYIFKYIGYVVVKVINLLFEHIIPIVDMTDFSKNEVWNGIASAWNNLPSEIIGLATYMNIPQAISIITTALVVKFIKNRVPFMR